MKKHSTYQREPERPQRGFRAKQAAGYLGISVSHFWNLVKDGKIGAGIKVTPRCTLWLRETLDAYLDSLVAA